MMDVMDRRTERIHLLEPVVADAIAAGEVVERPAAVVKELIDNALDAGATRISVRVRGGGIAAIEVHDNGRGMVPEDLPLAFARHATSKVSSLEDLTAIATRGFRGEALASIAAVSECTITTRSADASAATAVRAHFGTIHSPVTTARDVGTSVVVENLFGNTPARLRFLKGERGEHAAVLRSVMDAIIAAPACSFHCEIGEKAALSSQGGELRDVLPVIFGRGDAEKLLPFSGSEDGIHLHGFLSSPLSHHGNRTHLFVLVNGRRIHNAMLQHAIDDAYRGYLPAGRYPFGIVSIDCPREAVDVNVHPTKRDVRFVEPGVIHRAVHRAVWQVLSMAPIEGLPLTTSMVEPAVEHSLFAVQSASARKYAPPGNIVQDAPSSSLQLTLPDPGVPSPALPRISSLGTLRAVGQIRSTWLVAEGDAGIVLVDPHAAHEKILYEEIRRALAGEAVPMQALLVPLLVSMDPATVVHVPDIGEMLMQLGFAIDVFGEDMIRCTAVPALGREHVTGGTISSLVMDLLDEVETREKRLHRAAALLACHTAVRLGDALDLREQQHLLDLLVTTPEALTCPHGRPTCRIISDGEMRRAVGRPVIDQV